MLLRLFAVALVGCLLTTSPTARGDQAAWLTQEQAEAAREELWGFSALRIFCAPCGDTHWRPLVVTGAEMRRTENGAHYELVVSGEAIDLAYTYIPVRDEEGIVYRNLAMQIGMEVVEVPEFLDPWLTGPLPDFPAYIFSGEMNGVGPVIVMLEKSGGDLTGAAFLPLENRQLTLEGATDAFGAFTLEAFIVEDETYTVRGLIAPEAIAIRGAVEYAGGGAAGDFVLEQAGATAMHSGVLSLGPLEATILMRYPVFQRGTASLETDRAVSDRVFATLQEHMRAFAVNFTNREPGAFSLDPEANFPTANHHAWEGTHFEVVAVAPSLVSVVLEYYYYTGGAHGMSHSLALNLLSEGDGIRDLMLDELFADGADFWPVVTAYALDDLRAQGAAWVVQGSVTDIGDAENAVWTISRGGLTFHYDAYEMGPYAEGPYRVWVPFDALADVLAPGMPAALFAGE